MARPIMRRREFVTRLGGLAVASSILSPRVARAQPSAMPVIGFLHSLSPDMYADRLRGFRQGLKDTGHVEGENVAIEYRWAENQIDRLPMLAADLVRRQVTVIATTGGSASAFAAKAATTTIPIVFFSADDPVRLGLVTSLARPDGNLTGVNSVNTELVAKRLELLREMVPAATRVAALINPNGPNAETTLRDIEPAARTIGLQIRLLTASTSRELDVAFASLARERPDALYVSNDPFLSSRRVQLATSAVRHAMPMASGVREISEAGGLMSYGASNTAAWRQVGVYTGRILKGAKPADLPVMQSSKFDLVINAQTARLLELDVPPQLLARADEVIE